MSHSNKFIYRPDINAFQQLGSLYVVQLKDVDKPLFTEEGPATYILDTEHGTELDDKDLIAAIVEASHESPCAVDLIDDWSLLARSEQISLQIGWVAPMPM